MMDRNCVNNGVCFPPESRLPCHVTCTAISRCGGFIATGTRQGSVVLWKLRQKRRPCLRFPVSLRRFKEQYEHLNDISAKPYFMLLSSNNPIAIPVIQVAFASGLRPFYSLKSDSDRSASSFRGVHRGEDVLVSLHKDNSIAIWSLTDCRCLHKVKGPPFAIKRLCVLPDDRFMALVGNSKINVIDLWRLKLIGMLELNGTCHFDKNIYSTRPQILVRHSSEDELTLENSNVNTFNVTPTSSCNRNLYTKPRRILRATCGPAPCGHLFKAKERTAEYPHNEEREHNATRSGAYECPHLLSVLLDNHEMVLWDLTAPILAYKAKYGAFNDSFTVATRWDNHYHDNIGHCKRSVSEFRNLCNLGMRRAARLSLIMGGGGGDDTSNDVNETSTDFPMMRERIPELESARGEICVVDRYVFVVLGIRILVWFYDFEGLLTRTAELLSIGDVGPSHDDPWHGCQCVRFPKSQTLLIAWTVRGRVSVFTVPDATSSIKQFKLLKTYTFPKFSVKMRYNGNICVYIPRRSCGYQLELPKGEARLPPFYLIRHTSQGNLTIGMSNRNHWMSICTDVSLSMNGSWNGGGGVITTCLVYQDDDMHRIDVTDNGHVRLVNLYTGNKVEILSCTEIGRCIASVTQGFRRRPLVLPGSKVMEWVKTLPSEGPKQDLPLLGGYLVHCVGSSYVVICAGRSQLYVYSLLSSELRMVVCNMHCTPIKSLYSAYAVNFTGPKVSDSSFTELDDMLVTVDTFGGLVVIQFSLLSDDLENDDHSSAYIGDEHIYSENDSSDLEDTMDAWKTSAKHYLSTSVYRRGIHRMERSSLVRIREIERVVVDLNKDMLFALTHDTILVWRLRTGRFLRALPYLATYRQAVLLSSESSSSSVDRKIRHVTTFADTISSLLMTDWQTSSTGFGTEDMYQTYVDELTPHCLLSLCLFQEKCFKKRVSPSLHFSFLRLQFASNSSCSRDATRDNLTSAAAAPRRRISGSRLLGSNLTHSSFWRSHKPSRPLRCSRSRVPTWRSIIPGQSSDSYIKATSFTDLENVSHMTPVLIFPMQEVLSNMNGTGGSLLPKVADHGAVCYLGTPPGTVSIPLNYQAAPPKHVEHNRNRTCGCWAYHQRDHTYRNRWDGGILRSYSFTTGWWSELTKVPTTNTLIRKAHNNSYFSTCMLLRDIVLDEHSEQGKDSSPWRSSADVWLLGHLLVLCHTKETFTSISNAIASTLRHLTHKQLCLHVCRALAMLRCRDIPSNDPAMTFPEVRVCQCNGTTFSFGRICGFCRRVSHDLIVSHVSHPYSVKPWEVEVSLLLLVMIALDDHLSAMCNFVLVGSKIRTFASFVARLVLCEIVSPGDSKSYDRSDYPPARRIFDPKTYYLEMFARGFGTAWTLKTIDIYGILPPSFSRSKIHMLARSFYQSPHGSRSSAVQFVINGISLYRSSKSEHWLQILTSCFPMDPVLVMQVMRWIVQERRLDKWYTEKAVQLLLEFTVLFRELAIHHLPEIVVIIVRCLDPADPNMRMLMLKPATSALLYLVKNFPMVSFYQNTQRFAVGSTSGHVVIYDLRTATKCRILGGSMKNVSSIAFSATGEYIAAYYKDQPCLVIWNCSSSGFLGSLLHSGKKEHKVVKLKSVESHQSTDPMDIKIQSKSNREWFLHREDGRGYMISI